MAFAKSSRTILLPIKTARVLDMITRDAILKKDSTGMNPHERWTVGSPGCPYRMRTWPRPQGLETLMFVGSPRIETTYIAMPLLKAVGSPACRGIRRVDS